MIPDSMRADVLTAIHRGHLGLNKSRGRAKLSVWWPGLSNDLEQLIWSCEFCNINRPTQRSEPLKTTQLPSFPRERTGADLCELQGKSYLVVMDYFSRYLEIDYLDNITNNHVVGKLKNIFARWGIPEERVTDNGGQFSSKSFRQFSVDCGFHHIFSSPHYPQATEEAKSAVKIAKRILKQPGVFLAVVPL
jgi:transposase InsO family protein